jgi:hypothetical protein
MRTHAIIFVVINRSHFQQPFEMSKAALDFIQLFVSRDCPTWERCGSSV